MNKKQILFLACVIMFLVGVILFFVLGKEEQPYSSDYQESDRSNTVVYEGKEYCYNEHISNYLFVGIDTRDPIEEYETCDDAGRADAIFVLSHNRVDNTLKCISIPRDTMANVRMIALDGTDLGTRKEHINMQYAFGDGKDESCRLMKDAVSDILYNVPIQGYCSLNMDGIAVIAEVLEGVELTVPDDTLQQVNPEFVQGAKVVITKDNAEQFVRHRDTNQSQSAIDRMNRQKVFLKAAAQCAKEKSTDDTKFVVDLYEKLDPYMVTNMGNDIFVKLMQASYDSEEQIQDIPGEKVDGIEFDEYHINEMQLYELILQMFYVEVQGNQS